MCRLRLLNITNKKLIGQIPYIIQQRAQIAQNSLYTGRNIDLSDRSESKIIADTDEEADHLSRLDMANSFKEGNRYQLKRHEKKISRLNFDHIPITEQIVVMLPGYGTQNLKIGEHIKDNPASVHLFQQASEILNFDLLHGPKTLLDQNAQLAIFVSSLAAFEKMKTEQPDLMERVTDCAGFGLGEFSALVAGNILNFTDALNLMKIYTHASNQCCQVVPSGLMTIRTSAQSQLHRALMEARSYSKSKGQPAVCDIAAYLYSHVKIIGGTKKSLEYFIQHAELFKIQVIKNLPMNGAYNTILMKNAADEIDNYLSNISEIKVPRINVYSNFSGNPHQSKAHIIKRQIVQQITNPVKWEQISQKLFEKHKDYQFPSYFEVGPGKQLGSILYQICKKTRKTYLNYPA